MYNYFFKNILINMKINWKMYIVLFLELCLCFTLIYLGIDEHFSHGKRAEMLSQDQKNHIHTIQYQDTECPPGVMGYVSHSPILTMEELKRIESNKDIQEFYYAERADFSYLVSEEQIKSVKFIIANRGFFKQYLDVTDAKAEKCYVMPELLSEIKEEFISAPFNDAEISGDIIAINGKEFDFHQLSEALKPIVTSYFYDNDIETGRTIFFLKDETNERLRSGFFKFWVTMKYKTAEKNLDFETRESFFEELNGYANGKSVFSEMYIIQMFKRGGDDMNSRVRLFSWAGNIAFLIVVVGISGIFILIIQKRYKQLCICHINGLTKRGAFMQIFIEVLLLVSIPSIIGMILVITFQGKFNSIYYPIEWHPFTTVVFILLPIVITLIVTVVSSSWLRHLNVVKWLKRIE